MDGATSHLVVTGVVAVGHTAGLVSAEAQHGLAQREGEHSQAGQLQHHAPGGRGSVGGRGSGAWAHATQGPPVARLYLRSRLFRVQPALNPEPSLLPTCSARGNLSQRVFPRILVSRWFMRGGFCFENQFGEHWGLQRPSPTHTPFGGLQAYVSLSHPQSRGDRSSVSGNTPAHSHGLTHHTRTSHPRTVQQWATQVGWLSPKPSHALYI